MTPMDDRAWECSMCDEYSAEIAASEKRADEAERLRALWFNANSDAQATLGRVRGLADEWEADHGIFSPDSRYTRDVFVRELRAALGDE